MTNKYLFFTNTPAHVHLYKNAVSKLLENGNDVLVLGRDYGCTVDLLDYFDLPYELYGKCGTEMMSLLKEIPVHYKNIIKKSKKFKPDLVFGFSLGDYSSAAAITSTAPLITIMDNRPMWYNGFIFQPLISSFTKIRDINYSILSPTTVQGNLGSHHYRFNGFKETAYLHPDVYTPDSNIREELNISSGESFAIIRLNAFGSHHDVGKKGFSIKQIEMLIDKLSEHTKIFVSDEGGNLEFEKINAEPFSLNPALIHDALAESDLLIADTQTMVTEAALLGTPAIRSNTFVGDEDMGNFIELEKEGLIFNVKEFEIMLDKALELLRDDNTNKVWKKRRKEFLKDKVNLTDLIVDIALNYDGSDTVEKILKKYRKG